MKIVKLTPPTSRIKATIEVPGSKSYTNRALIIAAIASGRSVLSSASPSADSEAMIQALRTLGVEIQEEQTPKGTTITIGGSGGAFTPFNGQIDVGAAGTTMRFLAALCASIPGIDVELSGSERMHARPISELVSALRSLGAEIEYLGSSGCPPIRIHSKNHLKGGAVSLDGATSSQFISSLLLSAPLQMRDLTIEICGEQVSRSYIDMTIQSMQEFGVTVVCDARNRYTVSSRQRYQPRHLRIEGDASGASYLWGLAAISQGEVCVENINPFSTQGDVHLPEILMRMGCEISSTRQSITVKGPAKLKAVDIDMNNMPDVAQTIAVVAACAEGESVLRGLSTLRIKETDRIAALNTELAKIGITSVAGPDYLVVRGGIPNAHRISTYDDHRMAMSFAMLGAKIPDIEIEYPDVVGKSFPNFWTTLQSAGVGVDISESFSS